MGRRILPTARAGSLLECIMKKVIDGKLYDTKTAEFIATNDSNFSRGDFEYEDTDLYKTKKGNFFLSGEGGARSRWSTPVGNNGSQGGSGIEALTMEDARAWCEANDVDADIIAEHFPVEEA